MTSKLLKWALAGMLVVMAIPSQATKVLGLKVIDKNYLMVQFRDGEVHYRDNGTGPSAYLGHSFAQYLHDVSWHELIVHYFALFVQDFSSRI